jgi:galactokinase
MLDRIIAIVAAPSVLATEARRRFVDAFGYASGGVAVAPGRVNLIGEHTDYNDGFVLPLALELGVGAAFSPRTDGIVRAHSASLGKTEQSRLDMLAPHTGGDWFSYVGGTLWAMRAAGLPVMGLDLAIASNLPIAAGLSSSAALEMAVARAACEAADGTWDAPAMARIGQRAENAYVGVSCGIMDQFASAASVAGHALLLDCRSLETRLVPIPDQATVVVMDTGVRRGLAASEYNARRGACERAVAAVREIAGDVRALRDVDDTLLTRARTAIDDEAYRRARHVVAEIRRPALMAEAVRAGDLAAAGALMNQSHASLRDLYEVSSAELDAIVAEAQRHPGCYGARLTGAGFGGCGVALVAASSVHDFRELVEDGYEKRTGRKAATFATRPAAGAHII